MRSRTLSYMALACVFAAAPQVLADSTPSVVMPSTVELGSEVLLDGLSSDLDNFVGDDPTTWQWYVDGVLVGGGELVPRGEPVVAAPWIPERLGPATITLRFTQSGVTTEDTVTVQVVAPHANVTSFEYDYPVRSGIPTLFTARFGQTENVEVEWLVDGVSVASVDAPRDDDGEAAASLPYVFASAGRHEVTADVFVFGVAAGGATVSIDVELAVDSPDGPDTDGDGVADEAERFYGLDPYDPFDVDEDPDEDGIPSGEEIQAGTGPFVSNAPGAPRPRTPAHGGEVFDRPLVLATGPAVDPDGDDVRYDVRLAARDADGLLFSVGDIAGDPNGASVTVERALDDDRDYCWAARGCDAHACGPWSADTCFTLDLENQAPERPVLLRPLAVSGTTQPSFAVVNTYDADGDALSYRFELGLEGDLGAWSEEVVADPSGITVWSPTVDLDPGETYEWLATALDGRGGEVAAVGAVFTVDTTNEAPGPVTMHSPRDGAQVASRTLSVVVENGVDPDADALSIEVEARLTSGDGPVVRGGALQDDSGFTTLALSLPEQGEWRVEAWATDGSAEGPHDVAVVDVRTRNTPPLPPLPLSPPDRATVNVDRPVLEVGAADDPDDDEVTYVCAIAADRDFNEILAWEEDIVGDENGIVWASDAVIPDGARYYWRARAVDAYGGRSLWTEPLSFAVQVEQVPPSAPAVVFPLAGAEMSTNSGVVLAVQNATDDDSEALTYFFEVATDDGFGAVAARMENVLAGDGTTSALVPVQLPQGEYYWRAYASDGRQVGPSSDVARFRVVAPPTDESGCACTSAPRSGQVVPWFALVALGVFRRRRPTRA